jgi:hypothetical protein
VNQADYDALTWPDYEGRRFVAHCLTDAQVATLRQAALAAGIPEQQ